MTKHFYIFRHGQCPFNISNHIQGQRFNGILTTKGETQALDTAKKLKNKQIEIIISSPLKRTIQTAKIVSSLIKVPILIDHRFIEVNMGIIEGMHFSIVEKKYQNLYNQWRMDKNGNTRFAGGETKHEVRNRIINGLNYYATETSYQNVGISSHGIAISQILQFLGHNQTDIPNGSILHISYKHPDWSYNDFIH